METKKKTYVLTVSKVFLKGHPRSGQPTNFRQLILEGKKIHTIRAGDYWRKVAEEVNAGKAVLSVREWIGRPYNSKQEEFLRLEKVGWQGVRIGNIDIGKLITVGTWYGSYLAGEATIEDIAKNDGLSYDDFWNWFPKHTNGGIIHFTDFRY